MTDDELRCNDVVMSSGDRRRGEARNRAGVRNVVTVIAILKMNVRMGNRKRVMEAIIIETGIKSTKKRMNEKDRRAFRNHATASTVNVDLTPAPSLTWTLKLPFHINSPTQLQRPSSARVTRMSSSEVELYCIMHAYGHHCMLKPVWKIRSYRSLWRRKSFPKQIRRQTTPNRIENPGPERYTR